MEESASELGAQDWLCRQNWGGQTRQAVGKGVGKGVEVGMGSLIAFRASSLWGGWADPEVESRGRGCLGRAF